MHLLRKHGITYFLDYTSLEAAQPYDEQIEKGIRGASFFLLVLSKDALERCHNDDDWLRKEIRCALLYKRRIVPICEPSFQWPTNLPNDIASISRWQSLEYHPKYTDVLEKELCSVLSTELPFTKKTVFARGIVLLVILLVLFGHYVCFQLGRNTNKIEAVFQQRLNINGKKNEQQEALNMEEQIKLIENKGGEGIPSAATSNEMPQLLR